MFLETEVRPRFAHVNNRLSSFEFRNNGARCSRLVSCALLFLFAFGSLTQAGHHHGSVQRDIPAATTGTARSSSTPVPRGRTQSSECLVCQFQQSLSSAAIFTPLLVLAPATTNHSVSIPIALVQS